jgi:hypothetical protein
MTLRNFIDYAQDGDGVNSREALYAAIHDRVADHIEAKKQEIAQNLIAQNEDTKSPFPGSDEYKAKYPESKFEKEPSKSEKGGTVYRRKQETQKEEIDLDEAREDSPIKGTVKKASYEDGAHKVEVRYNHEHGEYSAHPYKNGKHMGEGPVSYHGDDKEDAHDTAKAMLKHLNK